MEDGKMCKEKIAIKGMLDYAATATLLDELAKSYKEKTVCIEMGEDVICLKPGDYIDVKVEASVKKGKQKLSISLSWKEELLSEEALLTISSKVPEAKLIKPEEAGAAKVCGKKDENPADKKCDSKDKKQEVKGAQVKEEKSPAQEGAAKGKEKVAPVEKK